MILSGTGILATGKDCESPLVSTTGLGAYYTFDYNNFLVDRGPYFFDLTNPLSAVQGPGKFNYALNTDGTNYLHTTTTSTLLEPVATGWTFSTWFYLPTGAPGTFSVFDKWRSGGLGGTRILMRDTIDILVTMNQSNMSFAYSSFPRDEWFHICVTWNGSTTVEAWLNGVSLGTTTRGSYTNGSSWRLNIGYQQNNNASYATGFFDDYIVWGRRKLTDEEIETLAEGTCPQEQPDYD